MATEGNAAHDDCSRAKPGRSFKTASNTEVFEIDAESDNFPNSLQMV